MPKFCILVLVSILYSQAGFSQEVEGLWYTENQAAKVKIYKCENSYCGDLVWLKQPNWQPKDLDDNEGAVLGQPKIDLKNDDKKLRSRPLIGMTLLTGLQKVDATEYQKGKIYDAESGNTYSCEAQLVDGGDTLKMTGYIGFSWLGRTTTWTRGQ